MDGTIYFGDKLADKANEIIKYARQNYGTIFFITNNSAKKRKNIYKKLIQLGIDLKENELINSSYVIAKYLKENNYKNVYCIGTEDLREEISSFGVNPLSKEPEVVVVGYNINFNLKDFEGILNTPKKDYKIIIANQERIYPRDGGIITPGAGAIIAALEYTLNRKIDLVMGKPNPLMLELMTKDLKFKSDEILVIGDSFESDVQMAKSFGSESILITNGNNKNDYNCIKVKDLKDILELI